MGQPIYFSDEELLFLRHEALEDVPDTYLSDQEKALLRKLKEKADRAIAKIGPEKIGVDKDANQGSGSHAEVTRTS